MQRTPITLGTVLKTGSIVIIACLFVLYVLWQSRVFIVGPVITLSTTPPATTTARTVEIAGRAENIVWIRLNDNPIATTPNGDFKESVILETGYTIIELEAADRFGRTTHETFSVVPLAATSTNS